MTTSSKKTLRRSSSLPDIGKRKLSRKPADGRASLPPKGRRRPSHRRMMRTRPLEGGEIEVEMTTYKRKRPDAAQQRMRQRSASHVQGIKGGQTLKRHCRTFANPLRFLITVVSLLLAILVAVFLASRLAQDASFPLESQITPTA